MTVSNTTVPRKDYTGNASVTVFAYDFRILANTHLEVLVDGTVKTLVTDYTVSGVDAATGGNVTFTAAHGAPASGKTVSIIRKVPTTQLTDYIENDDLTAKSLEDAFDKFVMWSQQADETLGRAIKFAKSSTKKDIDAPDPEAAKFLRWNSTATKLENATGLTTTQTISVSASNKRRPVTTSDGSTLVFGEDLQMSSAEQTGTSSFQTVEADMNIGAAFGTNTATAPVYGAGVMGNLVGTGGASKTANILAGVIGKIDLTGTIASTYPVAAVLGEIGNTVTGADAAFVAVLGGDTGVTTAPAAFAVDYLNSADGSKFDYGLDLWRAAHDSFKKVSFAQAAIRLPSNEWVKARNNADSTDLNLWRADTSDRLVAGTALRTELQAAMTLAPFGTAAGETGELRFLELAANGANYVGFKAANSLAANVIWTLPSADGTADQVMTTNGSGVLSFAAGSSVANPTASVGLTAVNGTATSAIRSDGAPALDVAIAPTWSGQHVFSYAGPAIRLSGASGDAQLVFGTSASDPGWTANAIDFRGESASGECWIVARTAKSFGLAINVYDNGANRYIATATAGKLEFGAADAVFKFAASGTAGNAITWVNECSIASGGTQHGAPTGGAKGAGTINAVAVYDDNLLLTDWAFDLYYDGRGRDDDPFYRGQRLYAFDETFAVSRTERRLPWMPTREAFENERSLGGMVSRLWFGQEQQQMYLFDLEQRLAALESSRAE